MPVRAAAVELHTRCGRILVPRKQVRTDGRPVRSEPNRPDRSVSRRHADPGRDCNSGPADLEATALRQARGTRCVQREGFAYVAAGADQIGQQGGDGRIGLGQVQSIRFGMSIGMHQKHWWLPKELLSQNPYLAGA